MDVKGSGSNDKQVNTITKFMMKTAMNMPTTHFTTLRGKGGFGSSTQKLADVFWQMTTSVASSTAVQALLHYYVAVTSAKLRADADTKVSYSFPMNTWSAIDGAAKGSQNDGNAALATGMKIYIA